MSCELKCLVFKNAGSVTFVLPSGPSVTYDTETGFTGEDETFLYHTTVKKVLSKYSEEVTKHLVIAMFLSSFGKFHSGIEVVVNNNDETVLEFLDAVMELNGAGDIKFSFNDFICGSASEYEELNPKLYDDLFYVEAEDGIYANIGVHERGVDILVYTKEDGGNVCFMPIPIKQVDMRDNFAAYNLLLWLGLWHSGVILTNTVYTIAELRPLKKYRGVKSITSWHSLYTISK